ncbi:LysR family transcriptional regulator (plasmid) [Pseudomonas luteola]|uniref:LysR family transcriptional regulator n=1 Tax=Pseudomonas luteola TaxID=47886 RepID=UPI003DA10296
MRIDDIEAFVAVIHSASLSQAAQALSITQSAITRRVQNLEEALGVTLLNRQTKPLTPTALGRRVYEQCVHILRAVGTLKGMVTDTSNPTGTLRLGVPQTLGEPVLLNALPRLKKRYPELGIQVSNGWGNWLVEQLEQDILDAVVALFPPGKTFDQGLHAQSLMTMPLQVVAAPGLLPTRCSLEECQSHGWILNPDGCGFRAHLQRALADRAQTLRLNMETFGTELQLGLTAEGSGLGLVPAPILNASTYRDRLAVIDVAGFRPEVSLWLIYPEQIGNLRNAIAEFGDDLLSVLDKD